MAVALQAVAAVPEEAVPVVNKLSQQKRMLANRDQLSPAFSSVSAVETLAMALSALWSNKLRTALTMLGVIIGIMAVIAVTSVGQGVQSATEANLQGLGADVLRIRAGAASSGNVSQGRGSATTLTWSDALAIESQVSVAEGVTAYLEQSAQVVHEQNNTSTTVIGTDTHYEAVSNITLQAGRVFTEK